MTLSLTMQSAFFRHRSEIQAALRHAIERISGPENGSLWGYYGQMRYHLGWVDTEFTPTVSPSGKLLRPSLLLFAYEAAGAWNLDTTDASSYLRRALPAAAAIELTHNFTLIHDDIEDEDAERHHRPTVWTLWGKPQAINTGDGLFALSRLALWEVLDDGVESAIAARLAAILDRACLTVAEGQYLDMGFETRLDISVEMYVDMINRKTAALMGAAVEMGARLGTRAEETIQRLRSFGDAIGVAFQVRDDLLGIWASTAESGKAVAGDIYRRKKSLPVLHALEHANADDQQRLREIYQGETPVARQDVEVILTIFARTGTQAYCREFLAKQCRLAHEALASVPYQSNPMAERAIGDMQTLVHFVEEAAKTA